MDSAEDVRVVSCDTQHEMRHDHCQTDSDGRDESEFSDSVQINEVIGGGMPLPFHCRIEVSLSVLQPNQTSLHGWTFFATGRSALSSGEEEGSRHTSAVCPNRCR